MPQNRRMGVRVSHIATFIKDNMARITSQRAAEMVGNRFDLVLIASARVRELKHGHLPKLKTDNGPMVTALREIEEGLVGRDYLKKVGIRYEK
jgi:DNA-directed RNA polymerase subunit omega